VTAVLGEAGADTSGVAAYLEGEGRADLERICREAEEKGVFGVPSFIVDGELFWGREHLPDIRERLAAPPVTRAS
jgi:2-hydroxychromene-2-carboxylate isomerase